MSKSIPPIDPAILTLELAKQRNRAAAERTLMAWIRTSLSLISFGVGINGVLNALYLSLRGSDQPVGVVRLTGIAFVALGTVAMIASTIDHRFELRRIQRGDFSRVSDTSLALIVAISLCLIGLFAFLGLAMKLPLS